jgi:hypothetical protein
LISDRTKAGRTGGGGALARGPLSTAAILAVAIAAAWASPAAAKADYEAVFHTMEECAGIQDVPERVACYDRTMAGARAAIGPGEAASVAAATTRRGFGAESMPAQDAPKPVRAPGVPQSEDELDSVTRVVASSRPIQGGIYAIAFEDGTEWRFVEGVPLYYNPPHKGEQVEIRRGALGSFRLMVDGEDPVRVKRTR